MAETVFYEIIVQNDCAGLTMGDKTPKKITVDFVWQMQKSITTLWNYKESVMVEARPKTRKLLVKYEDRHDPEEKVNAFFVQLTKLFATNGLGV